MQVRVTDSGGSVFGEGEEPKVKVWYGRLGRFLKRSEVPPFQGREAWFEVELKRGRFIFHRQIDPPENRSHFQAPPPEA